MPHSRPALPAPVARRSAPLAVAIALAVVALPGFAQKAPPAPAACTDFHAFANADWLAANAPGPAPVTVLAQLDARARGQQQQLLDAAMQSPSGPLQTLLGDFWASGLDEASIERTGAQPIAPLLAQVDGIRRARDLAPAIAALHQAGIPVVFAFGAGPAPSGEVDAGYFRQGGLGLGDPAFYTRDDTAVRGILAQYRDYVGKLLVLSGVPADKAAAQAQVVVDVETRIAQASRPMSLLGKATEQLEPVAVAGLDKQYPRLKLGEFVRAQGVAADEVSITNPQLFAQLDALQAEIKPEQWRSYLRFHVANAMAPHLSKPWRDAHFAFHGAGLRGLVMPAPRRQQVLDTLNAIAGPLLGRAYTQGYLPAATASRAQEIATQVREALGRGIDRNTWMSPQARTEAKAKLAALRIETGMPAGGADDVPTALGRASYGGNVLALAGWRHRQDMQRIGNAAAPARWQALPQQPALAYDPAANRLVATAAILQAPVLDLSQEPAMHYGAFGALVGHELSHGFDGRGRLVDASGTARDWWSPADATAWDGRLAQLTAQYLSFPIPASPGIAWDPRRIAAETAADLAGVELAAEAFASAQPAAPLPAQQAFYTAWSRLWAQQLTPNQAAARAAGDVHAPGYWRSNGPLINQPGFTAAFSCKKGTPMFRSADEQAAIWR